MKDEAWCDPWLKAMKRARMTSGEASLHLRELLKQQGKGAVDPPLTSHSLKVTLFSWACKCGEFSLADRQVLGHHLNRPSISALIYGRANFLAPLAKLAKWLELISQGKFRPDDNASAVIAQQLAIEESQSADQSIHRIHRTSGTLHILHASGQKFLRGRPKTFQCVSLARKSVRQARAREALGREWMSHWILRSAHFGLMPGW